MITEAAEHPHHLERLIYVAALVPLLGESALEACARSTCARSLTRRWRCATGLLKLNPVSRATPSTRTATSEIAEWAVSQALDPDRRQLSQSAAAPDVDVPSFYVRCTLDQAVDPLLQEVLAAKCDETVVLESGHCPMLSRPGTLVDAILGAPTRTP